MKMNFFVRITLVAVALVGGAIATMIIFGSGDTSEIEAVIAQGETALNTHDVEACMALIDENYSHDGANRDQVALKIRGKVTTQSYASVTFEETEIEMIGDTATVRLKMKFKGGSLGGMPYLPFRFSLRKIDGRWLVVAIVPPNLDKRP